MANRFPLVLDTTDNNKIKEIQAGDNLNLTDNSIVGVQNITALGTIDAADIKVNGNRLVAQAFNDLTDTPATFIGAPNYFVKVKADGTGLEYRPLSDLGNIEIDTITVDTSIVPTTDGTGNLGLEGKKFNEIVATTLKGNLVSFNEEIVFDATTGKISYAALQGAPTFLSEFTDDVGYLQVADLDTTLAGLFDDGVPFETDIVGSVFGDDSSILVDGINNIITGNILTSQGTITSITSTQVTSTGVATTTVTGNDSDLTIAGGGPTRDIVIGDAASASTNQVKIYNAVLETFNQGAGLGIAQLTAASDLAIEAGNRIKIEGGVPFRLASTTTSEQLAIAAQEGDLIYNTTTSRLQMYQGSAWKDVNGNVEATAGTSNFNNVVIAGNLTVTGTTTNVETTNTNITDNTITLNKGELGAGVTNTTSGIEIDRGTESNVTFVYDDSVDKWTLGSETLVAATFEGNLTGEVTATAIEIDGASGRLTFDSLTAPEIRNQDGSVRVVMFGEDYSPGTAQLYVEANDVWLYSNLLVQQNLDVIGELTATAFKGSVFADDSGVLLDAVNGKVVGDVDNTEVVTSTVQGRDSANLNIYRGTSGTVSLGDASSGDVTVSDSGISITSTAGVDINGAATGTVEIGTGATTGNVTIGKAGNTTTIDGTFNATLTGNVTGDVTGDVTGNVDNTTLTLGATDATTITIGNSGSTTSIAGNFALTNALVVNNITADDSISITTATGDGNAISIGPQGTNRAVNLTADVIRISGDVILPIVAKGGVIGDLKGSVVADDSTVMIDGQSGKIIGDIESTNIAGTTIRANTIENNATDDLAINVDGFININASTDDSGLSKIQMDQTGINYIELTTQPISPGNPADVANIAINATASAGDVVIGTTGSTRNQLVTIHNATVNGTLVGSAQGNHTGTLSGDVVGSVFSDDSSLMVDATNYAMFSDTMTLTPLNAEPVSPVNGMIAIADGTGWDPASNAKNTLVAYLGGAWVTVAAAA